MVTKLRLGLAVLEHLALPPSQIDAAAKLIESVGNLTRCARMALGIRAVLETPCVKQRIGGMEMKWSNDFASALLGESLLILCLGSKRASKALRFNNISVVVRNKVIKSLAQICEWRGDRRRIKVFEPFERFHCVLKQNSASCRTCD